MYIKNDKTGKIYKTAAVSHITVDFINSNSNNPNNKAINNTKTLFLVFSSLLIILYIKTKIKVRIKLKTILNATIPILCKIINLKKDKTLPPQ